MKLFKKKFDYGKNASKRNLAMQEQPQLTFAQQMVTGEQGRKSRKSVKFSASLKPQNNNDLAAEMANVDLENMEEEPNDKFDVEASPKAPTKKVGFGPRRITPSVVNLYGIDSASENVFMKTMGIDSGKEVGQLVQSRRNLMEDDGEPVSEDAVAESASNDPYNIPFESQFEPDEMRCLALVAHNHMKPAMKEFVDSHKEILKKFRLTGTNTTMTMLKDAFGNDPSVKYGPSFQSGPLGGDAELCALMCLEDLGGVLFFMDPLSAHPHQADIESLVRLTNVHNILTCCNPCSAHAMCFVLKCALEGGRKDKIPSFFTTLKSPGVAVYKEEQRKALEDAKNS